MALLLSTHTAPFAETAQPHAAPACQNLAGGSIDGKQAMGRPTNEDNGLATPLNSLGEQCASSRIHVPALPNCCQGHDLGGDMILQNVRHRVARAVHDTKFWTPLRYLASKIKTVDNKYL
jgi:hypothetical protein